MTDRYSILLDKLVDDSGEDWRHECECRAIMKMPSGEGRAYHMRKLADRRGQPAADKIKRDIEVLKRKIASGGRHG